MNWDTYLLKNPCVDSVIITSVISILQNYYYVNYLITHVTCLFVVWRIVFSSKRTEEEANIFFPK